MMIGCSSNSQEPQHNVTKEEDIQSIVFDEAKEYSEPATYKDGIINEADTILSNATFTGNLTIAASVKEGDVTLKNVSVNGQLIIQGGGSDCIYLQGGNYNEITLEKQNTRSIINENTSVKSMIIYASNQVEVSGEVQKILVRGTGLQREENHQTIIIQAAGSAKEIIFEAAASLLSKGTIQSLFLSSSAAGTQLELGGATQKIIAEASSTLNIQGIVEEIILSQHTEGTQIQLQPQSALNNMAATEQVVVLGEGKLGNVFVSDAANLKTEIKPAKLIVDQDPVFALEKYQEQPEPTPTPKTAGNAAAKATPTPVPTSTTITTDSSENQGSANTPVPTINPSTTWDGTSRDTTWYSADKTEFVLTTAAQLVGLSDLVNNGTNFLDCTIKLAKDIDLNNKNWTPIGKSENVFSGTFNGQGHTIKNLWIQDSELENAGLFGYVDQGELTSIKMENVNISAKIKAGAIVGNFLIKNPDAKKAIISDCHIINGNIKTELNLVSGIVGQFASSGAKVELKLMDCSASNIEITAKGGTGEAAGIAAQVWNETSSSFIISGNTADGAIINSCSQYFGGILGRVRSNQEYSTIKVEKCRSNHVTLKNDFNNGSGFCLGGIAGGFYSLKSTIDFIMEDCHVTNSSIQSDGNMDEGYTVAGGLLGYNSKGSTLIKDCSVQDTSVGNNVSIGGVLGHTEGTVTITNTILKNVHVSGNEFVGIFVGYPNENNVDQSCQSIDCVLSAPTLVSSEAEFSDALQDPSINKIVITKGFALSSKVYDGTQSRKTVEVREALILPSGSNVTLTNLDFISEKGKVTSNLLIPEFKENGSLTFNNNTVTGSFSCVMPLILKEGTIVITNNVFKNTYDSQSDVGNIANNTCLTGRSGTKKQMKVTNNQFIGYGVAITYESEGYNDPLELEYNQFKESISAPISTGFLPVVAAYNYFDAASFNQLESSGVIKEPYYLDEEMKTLANPSKDSLNLVVYGKIDSVDSAYSINGTIEKLVAVQDEYMIYDILPKMKGKVQDVKVNGSSTTWPIPLHVNDTLTFQYSGTTYTIKTVSADSTEAIIELNGVVMEFDDYNETESIDVTMLPDPFRVKVSPAVSEATISLSTEGNPSGIYQLTQNNEATIFQTSLYAADTIYIRLTTKTGTKNYKILLNNTGDKASVSITSGRYTDGNTVIEFKEIDGVMNSRINDDFFSYDINVEAWGPVGIEGITYDTNGIALPETENRYNSSARGKVSFILEEGSIKITEVSKDAAALYPDIKVGDVLTFVNNADLAMISMLQQEELNLNDALNSQVSEEPIKEEEQPDSVIDEQEQNQGEVLPSEEEQNKESSQLPSKEDELKLEESEKKQEEQSEIPQQNNSEPMLEENNDDVNQENSNEDLMQKEVDPMQDSEVEDALTLMLNSLNRIIGYFIYWY